MRKYLFLGVNQVDKEHRDATGSAAGPKRAARLSGTRAAKEASQKKIAKAVSVAAKRGAVTEPQSVEHSCKRERAHSRA